MKINAVVDELHKGHHAVLLVGPEEIEVHWPAKYLPGATRESDVLSINVNIDDIETKRRKDKTKKLINNLKCT